MEYQSLTPEDVAALFAKHGIRPNRRLLLETNSCGDRTGCALAVLGCELDLFRKVYPGDESSNWMYIPDAAWPAQFPEAWRFGLVAGFDGVVSECGPEPADARGKALFAEGRAFGHAVAALVFPAVPA